MTQTIYSNITFRFVIDNDDNFPIAINASAYCTLSTSDMLSAKLHLFTKSIAKGEITFNDVVNFNDENKKYGLENLSIESSDSTEINKELKKYSL